MESKPLDKLDPKDLIKIETDASGEAIGAIMYQGYKGKDMKVINFCSRKLKDVETRYSTIEKELLAIHYAIKKFNPYLIGSKVKIYTDHKPLISVIRNNESKLPARWNRRLMDIVEYAFEIEYIPGECNKAADYLSRRINVIKVELPKMGELQKNDWSIQKLKKDETYVMEEGVLTKIRNNGCQVVVLPKVLQPQAVKEAHLEGHFGIKKTLNSLEANYFWKGMKKDVEEYIQSCSTCLRFNPARQIVQKSQHIEGKGIWTDIAMDVMGPFEIYEQNVYYLVVIDIVSKYIYGRATLEPTSKLVIEVLRDIFNIFGTPKTILSDNISYFVSDEITQFYGRRGIQHRKSSIYNPQGNSVAERSIQTVKRTFVKMCQTMMNPHDALTTAIATYNNSHHRSTNKTPFELMFGRRVVLPIRRILEIEEDNTFGIEDVVRTEEEREKEEEEVGGSIQKLHKQVDQYQILKKKILDKKEYEIGSKVMIKKEKRKNNLTPRYYGPFTIKDRIGPNVYKLEENDKLISVRRMKKCNEVSYPEDVDWSMITYDEEEEEMFEDIEPLREESFDDLRVAVDNFYENMNDDVVIKDMRCFGNIGHIVLRKLLRRKPKEKVLEKIRQLREQHF